MERGFSFLKDNGFNAQVNMQSWMFLSSYEKSRQWLLETKTFITMAHLGARAFSQITGEVVQTTAWVLSNQHIEQYRPVFFRLIEGNEAEKQQALLKQENRFDNTQQDDFKKIPGSPIAYWVSDETINCFEKGFLLKDLIDARIALATGDNDRFIRYWNEVPINKIGFKYSTIKESLDSKMRWFPCNKGGGFRKWYGNNEVVINWENDGEEVKALNDPVTGRIRSHNYNGTFSFKESLTWSALTSGTLGVRFSSEGFMFVTPGSSAFKKEQELDLYQIQSLLSSKLSNYFLALISATMNIEVGNILRIPYIKPDDNVSDIAKQAIELEKIDWDVFETSWDFKNNPLIVGWVSDSVTRHIEAENVELRDKAANPTYALSDIYAAWQSHNRETIAEMQRLEQENNRLFIDAYGLQDELSPDVPLEQITLTVNPKYRYGGKLSDEALENRFQSDTLAELISYAIGCMMGRYSLDQPGLVYAHAGNQGFSELVQQGAYKTFPADKDGIIPLTDQAWFADDATHRLREFVRVVWGEENHQQNLDFIAASLCLYAIKAKSGESNLDTIRRYLATKFYKDHLKTYKKRPIYWLFSSGKNKAFECLVYLHRYNESTLARMRTEYVTPLLGKYAAHAEQLQKQRDDASSTAEANRYKKALTALEKKQTELSEFDDKLKHTADMRISLDLDDGVKVNYGKFGDLLADVKAVHGKNPEMMP